MCCCRVDRRRTALAPARTVSCSERHVVANSAWAHASNQKPVAARRREGGKPDVAIMAASAIGRPNRVFEICMVVLLSPSKPARSGSRPGGRQLESTVGRPKTSSDEAPSVNTRQGLCTNAITRSFGQLDDNPSPPSLTIRLLGPFEVSVARSRHHGGGSVRKDEASGQAAGAATAPSAAQRGGETCCARARHGAGGRRFERSSTTRARARAPQRPAFDDRRTSRADLFREA